MNRRKKFILNSISGLIKQIITLVCGFIMTRAILVFYGSTVNGLISSITQFLGFICFLEMGIGPVIQSNLYKPLAKKNDLEISRIVKASNLFFRRIAYIFLIYIIILCFILPRIINTKYSIVFTVSLMIIISISSFAQYFFGMTYQLLLSADQKGYIQITIQWVTLLINTILCVILMNLGASIHIVKLVTSVIFVIRPLSLCLYVRKNYNLIRDVDVEKDTIKQKWNGFAQHIAAVVVDNTDVSVLTILSTLENVSIYTVYYTVVSGVSQIIFITVNGLESLWGNMLAKNEWKILNNSFDFIEWMIHTSVTIIFIVTALLLTPFVKIYTTGVNDVNYNQPIFGYLLVVAFSMQCLRIPYFRLIKAAGHYKETQNGAFISMMINLILSIIFVNKYGLVGVAIGTLIALMYHTFYFVWYLKNHIINRKVKYFMKHLIIDLFISVVAVLCTRFIHAAAYNYFTWILLALKISLIVSFISIMINLIFYNSQTKVLINNLLGKIKKI